MSYPVAALASVCDLLAADCNAPRKVDLGLKRGSVYEIVLRRGLLSKEKLDAILKPEVLTQPQPISRRE